MDQCFISNVEESQKNSLQSVLQVCIEEKPFLWVIFSDVYTLLQTKTFFWELVFIASNLR